MSDYHLHSHPHEPTPDGPPPGEYPISYLERYVEAAAARRRRLVPLPEVGSGDEDASPPGQPAGATA